MLEAFDIGQRVVVRRRVGTGSGGRPLLGDLLGDLIALDDDHLVVRTRDGREHAIARGDVTAAKRIPPRPAKYSEIVALELIADAAWPAPVHDHLGEWILRAAGGWTRRANSALPLGDPGMPLDDAIGTATSWYAERRLRPAVNVPLPLRRDVGKALAERGWRALPPVLVQVASLSDVEAGRRTAPTARPTVILRETPSADFLAVTAARKRSLPDAAHHVLTAVDTVRFAEVRGGDGALLAMARGAIVSDWLHLGLVEVTASARRRGLALGVNQALAAWGAREGRARRAFVQVEGLNAGALALYAGLGFVTHHRYVTYRATQPPWPSI